MTFTKNDPRINRAGRPRNTRNKVPADIRSRLKLFLDEAMPEVRNAFFRLDDAQKVAQFGRLLPFILPTMKSEDLNVSMEGLSDDQVSQLLDELINVNAGGHGQN